MSSLEEIRIQCPYCGESIWVLVNQEEAGSDYIEDCQVCCRPITIALSTDEDGEMLVQAHREDDA